MTTDRGLEMEQNFQENIIKLTKEKPLYQFDRFFIRKMLKDEIWFNEKNVSGPVEETQGLYNMTARHLSELLRIAVRVSGCTGDHLRRAGAA